MKTLIVGTGIIGVIYGRALSRAGVDAEVTVWKAESLWCARKTLDQDLTAIPV